MSAALRIVVNNGPSVTRPIRARFAAHRGRQALRLVVAASSDDATLAAIYREFPQWRSLGRPPTLDDYLDTLPSLHHYLWHHPQELEAMRDFFPELARMGIMFHWPKTDRWSIRPLLAP